MSSSWPDLQSVRVLDPVEIDDVLHGHTEHVRDVDEVVARLNHIRERRKRDLDRGLRSRREAGRVGRRDRRARLGRRHGAGTHVCRGGRCARHGSRHCLHVGHDPGSEQAARNGKDEHHYRRDDPASCAVRAARPGRWRVRDAGRWRRGRAARRDVVAHNRRVTGRRPGPSAVRAGARKQLGRTSQHLWYLHPIS